MTVITTDKDKTIFSSSVANDDFQFDISQSDITFYNTGSNPVELKINTVPTRFQVVNPGMQLTINDTEITGFSAKSIGSNLQVTCSPFENESDNLPEKISKLNGQLNDMTYQKIRNKYMSGKHPNCFDTYGALVDDFSTGWSVSSACTIAVDTSITKFGSQSLKVTGTTLNTGASIVKNSNINFNGSIGTLGIWVYLYDVVSVCYLHVWLASTTDYSKCFESDTKINTVMKPGWNLLTIDEASWINNGADSWSNTMIRFKIRIDTNAGQKPIANLAGIFAHGIKSKAKLLIEFDDAWQSAYMNGMRYMIQKGLKGTVNYALNYASNTDPMTLSQYKSLVYNGWTIGNHTNTHPNLNTLTKDQQLLELETCRKTIVQNGLGDGLHVAFPYGFFNAETLAIMRENGYKTGREVGGQSKNNQLAVPEWWYMMKCKNFDNTVTLQNGKDMVDAIIADKCVGILLFHPLATVADSSAWGISDFKALMDYILTKSSSLDVVTREELYDMLDTAY